jgi:protocatechuate 3,4-dioxygenase beta subunit
MFEEDTHDAASASPQPSRTLSRRQALGLLGAAGAVWSIGCDGETPASPTSTAGTTTTTTPTGTNASCAVTPQETVGPYPSLADFIRSDIREGKSGLPVTLTITVVNVNSSCSPVSGAAVEIWQCDAEGNYSQYGTQRTETYLRGVQTTDAGGRVTFTTVYPGWYQGRATHIHVDVAVNGRSVKVTQIAFPEDITAAVYRTGVYSAKGLNPTTNASDNVFGDGVSQELATLTGDATNGYTATFQVGVSL